MRLNAQTAGDPAAPALVLLHGLFGRSRNLGLLARHFATRCHVLSLDLRNHGDSPHAPGMDYPTLASDVLETLDAHGVNQATLIGHSMGGKTAMMAALMAPPRVSQLVVIDIAPRSYDHHNAAVAAALQAIPLHAPLSRAAAETMLEAAVPLAATRQFLVQNLRPGAEPAWQIGLDHIAASMRDIESWPPIAAPPYAGPALFLAGANSDYITTDDRGTITALFPASQIEYIAAAGHWVHADQPTSLITAIARFLGR